MLARLFESSGPWQREGDITLVKSKLARILEIAEGKEVLDVGCIGGDPDLAIQQTTHGRIAEKAKYCLGIDTVAPAVDRWRAAGYHAAVANAETFQLQRKFDVIIAADLIEHLANPGQFLDRAREHLKPSGVLCIVTPNALALNSALKTLLGLRVRVNPEHTCWYDRTTLRQLLNRCGFEVVEEYWQDYQVHPLTALAVRLRKNLAAHFIVVAKPNRDGVSL